MYVHMYVGMYVCRYVQNKHNRRISMSAAGLEPATPAIERLQSHALDRAHTGIGMPTTHTHTKTGTGTGHAKY